MKYKRHFQHCNSAILVVLSCVDPSQPSESTQRVERAFIISACGFSFLFSKQPLCKRSRRETKTAEWWLGGEPERDPQSTRSCFRPSHIWGPLCLSLSLPSFLGSQRCIPQLIQISHITNVKRCKAACSQRTAVQHEEEAGLCLSHRWLLMMNESCGEIFHFMASLKQTSWT